MQTQYALYLSDASIIFCEVDAKGVTSVFTHALTEPEYVDSLRDFLFQYQPTSFNVYLDVMGEDIKQESIPHIGLADRERLLARKSKSLLPSADLIWKKHLRRKKTGRKDDVYLLVGVPLPVYVAQVFELLIQTKQMITGVYSQSILEQEVQASLMSSTHSLLVSRVLGSPQGKKIYRQTFFKDGELAMSRVSSIGGETYDQVFTQLVVEIERMRHFLLGTRQIDKADKLVVTTVLGEEESRQSLRYEKSKEWANLEPVSLAELAKRKGLGHGHNFLSLAELLIYYSSLKKLKPHFKPKALTAASLTATTKKNMTIAAVVILALSLSVAVFVGYGVTLGKNKLSLLNEDIRQLQVTKQELVDNAPLTELEPLVMKQVVELYRHINAYQFGPDKVLPVIARAYQGFSDISLREFSWLKEGQANGDAFMTNLMAPRQFSLKISLPSGLGNRQILEQVSDFSSALSAQANITSVTRDRAMLDASANAKIAASLGRAAAINRPVEFTLLITMAP